MSLWFSDLANAKEDAYFRARDQQLMEAMRTRDLSQMSGPKGDEYRIEAQTKKEQRQPRS